MPSALFATRSLRVLLIDDDPALLESLRTALEDEGHKVVTASGGPRPPSRTPPASRARS